MHVPGALADANAVGVLDARSGRLLRTVAVGVMPAALAVDSRRQCVFVVNAGDGTLSVLDARTGTVLQTRVLAHKATTLTTPDAIAVDAARDRVYVTAWGRLDRAGVSLDSGLLFVLDARDGAVLRTLAVGVAPRAAAVEAGSGHVVVVDIGGAIHLTPGWAERGLRQVAGWLPWLRRIAPRLPKIALLPGSVRVIDAGA